jgi:ATP/maltotriose-dependent transcriptional regulator MalT
VNDNKLETNPRNKGDEGGIERNNFPLIQTKIQIPLRRSDNIVRSRLVKHIHANMDRKLIIISAPAGYGKTSMLLDFANDTDLPVCWYTIDSFDKDLRIFLEYLIAAIELQFPGFGSRSRKILSQTKDPDRNIYPIVATIVQEIHEHIPEYFILVLEDHHTIENQDQINEFLDLFVSFIDENCHLILTSRGLPALPNLSLLIARQQTSGMGIEDLRFTPPEIQELAQQTHNLRISLSQAEVLARRTGGWITGLQLTDSSAWKQASKAEYLEQLSPHIYDYLSKQVGARKAVRRITKLLA